MPEQNVILPVVPRCIPHELRTLKQWVIWKLTAKDGDKPTKIPFNPRTRKWAKSSDPHTWTDFEAAWQEYQRSQNNDTDYRKWSGLGFMFAAENGLVGIDLDKCRSEGGEIAPWAREIIDRFRTYAEVSPSSTGVKLWARGKLPLDGTGRKRQYQTGAVEMYSRGRFFAVTGHRLEPGADGINEAQSAIDWLWNIALSDTAAPTQVQSPKSKVQSREPDEAKILERARKYVAAMPAAVSGQGGHDATFEVACKLVLGFRLAPRAAMQIMREYSARCQPPWSERDLWHKLNSADKQTGERGYLLEAREKTEGRRQKAENENPKTKIQNPKSVSDAGGQVLAKDLDPRVQVEALIKSITRDGVPAIRFWRGTFWRWSNGRYRSMSPSEVRVRMVRHLNAFCRKLTREVVSNHLMQFESQTELDTDFEAPAWLNERGAWNSSEVMACRNALVHLPGFLAGAADFQIPATPAYFNTASTDLEFDRAAAMPAEWQKFLESLWPGDEDSIELLREWFGYCLTADTSQQKILFILGPRRSGKGTIASILARLVGRKNIAGPLLAEIGDKYGLWSIYDKSLAIVGDAHVGGKADAVAILARLKSISGEDALTFERKFLEPLTATLPTRIMILANELPRLIDTSGALSGRLLILRLGKSWFGAEDKTLKAKLYDELPGILLWSITGWRRLRERGYFVEPAAASEVRREFEELSSPIGAFLRDRCEVSPGLSIATGELYAAYREWCEASGSRFVETIQRFGTGLRSADASITCEQRRENGSRNRFFTGVCLRPDSF